MLTILFLPNVCGQPSLGGNSHGVIRNSAVTDSAATTTRMWSPGVAQPVRGHPLRFRESLVCSSRLDMCHSASVPASASSRNPAKCSRLLTNSVPRAKPHPRGFTDPIGGVQLASAASIGLPLPPDS